MKSLVFLIFSFGLSSTSWSQEEFSFELTFEDALGNRDTLILGYDSNATDSIDANFNEINLGMTPWVGQFEVRAGDKVYVSSTSPPQYQSKKQIIDKTCSLDFDISINIKTDNFPVVIRWDSSLFTDPCREASILSSASYFSWDTFGLITEFLGSFNATNDSVVVFSNQLETYSDQSTILHRLWLTFCSIDNLPTADVDENYDKQPLNCHALTRENRVLKVPVDITEFQINDLTGQTVYMGFSNDGAIELPNIPTGHYFINLYVNSNITSTIQIHNYDY